MNAELKQKWIDALLSGEYTQGKSRLRNTRNEYCCLGVLGDVIDNTRWKDEGGGWFWGGESGLLPHLFEGNGELQRHTQRELATKNDGGYTFAQIAAWIKVHVPGEA